MKNYIRILVIAIFAATLLTMTTFASIAGTFQAGENFVREIAGYLIGAASTVWAVKEFSKKSMFQTVVVILAGVLIGLLIGQPDWLKSLGNDFLNTLKVGG